MADRQAGARLVGGDADGWRLDRWLAQAVPTGRGAAAELVRTGAVTVNGTAPRRPAAPVRRGDRVSWRPVPPSAADPGADAIAPAVQLVYADAELAVVDKPAGLTVHPGAGRPRGTLADGLRQLGGGWSTLAGADRPGIVHRLDRTVSGLLVVARTEAAHRHLAAQLQDRSLGREYFGLVHGVVREDRGRIEAPIGRDPRRTLRMAVVAGGREAITEFEVLERLAGHTALRLRLLTGRTHQLRVHLAYIRRPLVGDPLYDPGPERRLGRPMLHAAQLHLIHPDGRPLAFRSPLPSDLGEAVGERGGIPGEWPGAAPAGRCG
ncbi:MAG TPA: RluA family pseudouridine synthase [Verrucomicrobiae bacterium]|nr:RluA family pseudouridine synthase [Verrucomicrobiae bacterium]